MAKSWSGFLPLNEVVKARWQLVEASQELAQGFVQPVSAKPSQARRAPAKEQSPRRMPARKSRQPGAGQKQPGRLPETRRPKPISI
jgi:hypothetical protein